MDETRLRTLLAAVAQPELVDIGNWSAALRKQPSREAAVDLRDFLAGFLRQEQDPKLLSVVLEKIRPGIHQVKLVAGNIPKPEEAVNYLQFLALEAKSWERVILLASERDDNETLSLAIHRNLANLVRQQTVYYQAYLPIPENLWLRIHRLFYIANEYKLGSFATIDKILLTGKSLSILDLYGMCLLLGCGRLNHLTPAEISLVSRNLLDWCTLVGISQKPSTSSDNQLVVDITTGQPPSFSKLFAESDTSISCYLQVDKLVEKLDKLIPAEPAVKPAANFGAETQTLSKEIIKHLKSAWSEYIYRETRVPTDETVQACLGINTVFFYLAGACTLKDFIGSKVSLSIVYEEKEDVATIEKHRSGDIWSAFTSVPDGSLVTGNIPTEFNFQHYFPDRQPGQTHAEQPAYPVKMTDTSSKGCRLQWDSAPDGLDVGNLVGIRRDDKGHWQVGEIAWKDKVASGKTLTGIKLLSTRAIPVAVDMPLRLAKQQNYMEALLFPPEESLGTTAVTFTVSPIKLKEKEYLAISQKGIEEKIHLNKQLKSSAFLESYECAFVVKKPSLEISRKK